MQRTPKCAEHIGIPPTRFRSGRNVTKCSRSWIEINRTKGTHANGADLARGNERLKELDSFAQCFLWCSGHVADLINNLVRSAGNYTHEFRPASFNATVELLRHRFILPLSHQ